MSVTSMTTVLMTLYISGLCSVLHGALRCSISSTIWGTHPLPPHFDESQRGLLSPDPSGGKRADGLFYISTPPTHTHVHTLNHTPQSANCLTASCAWNGSGLRLWLLSRIKFLSFSFRETSFWGWFYGWSLCLASCMVRSVKAMLGNRTWPFRPWLIAAGFRAEHRVSGRGRRQGSVAAERKLPAQCLLPELEGLVME